LHESVSGIEIVNGLVTHKATDLFNCGTFALFRVIEATHQDVVNGRKFFEQLRVEFTVDDKCRSDLTAK